MIKKKCHFDSDKNLTKPLKSAQEAFLYLCVSNANTLKKADNVPLERLKDYSRLTGLKKMQKECAWDLLYFALKDSFNLDGNFVEFNLSENGKWGCKECYFSISHSDNLVAVAVSKFPLGIDIEKKDLKRFNDNLADKILSGEEKKGYLSIEDKAAYLVDAWTKKEAAFKLYGGEKLKPFYKFSTAKSEVDTTVGYNSLNYSFDGDEYVISVALEGSFILKEMFVGIDL